MVRPFVLVALLDHLIDKNHEVFRGKGSAAELRAKMRAAVEREYPEEEAAVPETERMGTIPRSIHQLLEESEMEDNTEQQVASEQKHKQRRLLEDKKCDPRKRCATSRRVPGRHSTTRNLCRQEHCGKLGSSHIAGRSDRSLR